MEEWVVLGESGSEADTVQFVDGSDDDKGSEMSFTTVQIDRNRRAAEAFDSFGDDEELPGSPIGSENEEDSNGEYGYFDLDLPALAGSKAVFGASGDCFDPNLAASVLSMGNVGFDTAIHGGQTEDMESDAGEEEQSDSCTRGRLLDDIDMESIGAADGTEDTESDEGEQEQSDSFTPGRHLDEIDIESIGAGDGTEYTESDAGEEDLSDSSPRGRHLDNIDMESICAADGDGIEQLERRICAQCSNIDTDQSSDDAAEVVMYDDIDTESSDTEGSNYANDTEQPESYSCGRHLDDIDTESVCAADDDGDDIDTESACAVGYDDIDTESSDAGEEQSESHSWVRYLDDLDTESVCAADGDNINTENSDMTVECNYNDDATESSDESEGDYSEDGIENSDADDCLADRVSMAASPPPSAPHLFFPNRAGASKAASWPPSAPHLFFPNRAEASMAASQPPGAPHLFFPNGAGASTAVSCAPHLFFVPSSRHDEDIKSAEEAETGDEDDTESSDAKESDYSDDDTESSEEAESGDDDDTQSSDAVYRNSYYTEDGTENSDAEESDSGGDGTDNSDDSEGDYSEDGTESSDKSEDDYSGDGTKSSDESEDNYSGNGTESSDTEGSYYTDDGTECSDASGITGGGDDTRNLDVAADGASMAASRTPSAAHLDFIRTGATTARLRALLQSMR